jgi:ABC-type multidrug transport system permease subunit
MADPLALMLWLVIPLLVGGLMALVFGGDNAAPPKATVLLVDEDNGLAGTLLGGAAQGGGGDFLDIRQTTREEGMATMNAGGASALVVLPSGFSQAVLNLEPTTISLVRNPAQIILPGIVQTGLEMLVELISYVQRLFAEPLAQILDATPGLNGFLPNQAVALFSGSINERLQRVGGWLFPPVLSVEFVDSRSGGEATAAPFNVGALFLPSMMFMAVLFIAQGMSDDLWNEKDNGTLRRAMALPHPLSVFIASKVLATGVIMSAVGVVGLSVLWGMGAVTLARMPVALVWITFGGTAVFCYFLAIQFLASTRRGASVLGNVVLFPMMMIGGAFFPPEAMPPWMRAVGEWTPNGQALARFKDLLAGSATVESLIVGALAIGLPAALAFFVSARLAGGAFASRA